MNQRRSLVSIYYALNIVCFSPLCYTAVCRENKVEYLSSWKPDLFFYETEATASIRGFLCRQRIALKGLSHQAPCLGHAEKN